MSKPSGGNAMDDLAEWLGYAILGALLGLVLARVWFHVRQMWILHRLQTGTETGSVPPPEFWELLADAQRILRQAATEPHPTIDGEVIEDATPRITDRG